MIKFNIGEGRSMNVLEPAMGIKDEAEATAYLQAYKFWISEVTGIGSVEADKTAKSNLAYWAGYHDNETRERVERLFHCSHPIFGKISEGTPTPKEAFGLGKKEAIKQKTNKNED